MNALYDKARQAFLEGSLSWNSDDIRVILIDTNDYTVNLNTHDNLDDIPALARVAVSSSLTGKTTTDGVADANDVTFVAVSGDQAEAFVIYKHTGNEATSKLIAYMDTVAGLPVTPSGSDIVLQFGSGADKIFKL